MPKPNKVNIKEKVKDNLCDLSLSELREIPVRDIVKFMSVMQVDALKAEKQYTQEIFQNQTPLTYSEEVKSFNKYRELQQKSKKIKKSKSKKKSTQSKEHAFNTVVLPSHDNITIAKTNKIKRSANGSLKSSQSPSTALTSLLIFLIMVAFNVILIYMIMFKNPEIAEIIVESIPHQYRDWILTKTEIFRLRVTDWISEFRTPPEEH